VAVNPVRLPPPCSAFMFRVVVSTNVRLDSQKRRRSTIPAWRAELRSAKRGSSVELLQQDRHAPAGGDLLHTSSCEPS
jgi:hypothetical protein